VSPRLRLADVRVDIDGARHAHEVLRGVSFEVHAGEALGVVGESGSGKTMSARTALRLLPAGARIRGNVEFEGRSILSLDDTVLRSYRRRHMGMIFQDPHAAINPLRRIGDFLTELDRHSPRAERASARARALALLASVSIPDPERVFGLYPHQLSGGMLQRVMIASVLLQRPELIIADEPTTALDVTTQADVVALLDQVRREHGISLVFISHDIELVSAVCDRIVVMRAGEVVETLTPQQLRGGAIRDPYTSALLACRPSLNERKPRLPTLADFGVDAERQATACVPADAVRAGADRGPAAAVLLEQAAAPAGTPATATVEACGLSKTFGGRGLPGRRSARVGAVKDVSFRLAPGTTLAIVGESGSGKTTLARMITGLETPSAGTIALFGRHRRLRPTTAERRAHAREIQMVFQNPYQSLDPRQSVGDALDEVLRLHYGLDRAERTTRVAGLLAAVHLDQKVAGALPRQLSGGQRQRACIARALAAEPRILVLDEAVSALDVSVQAQVLNVLADIRDQTGVSYLFITHDLAVVRQIADEVIVMRSGAVVERGPAEEILGAPQHDYTRLLLDSVPRENWKPGRR
jgi:peptide/nickel transport system ATP-binding protein